MGVLFASLCAALMFAKVARVQSFAQVTFSAPVVIRYGTGVMTEGDDDDDDDDGSSAGDPAITHIPCPVLEFRIFNRMSSLVGGEIIDATLNMVASIDASQADPTLQSRSSRRKRGKKKRGPTRAVHSRSPSPRNFLPPMRNESSLLSERSDESAPDTPDKKGHASIVLRDSPLPLPERGPAPSLVRRPIGQQNANDGSHLSPQAIRLAPRTYSGGRWSNSVLNRFPSVKKGKKERKRQDSGSVLFTNNMQHVSMRNTDTQAFEEDPSGKIIPKKILSKLEVECPDHPFFRRIWLVRHTLDMNSLLLKPHVRNMLRRNHGFWPKELNNYESIRASIAFDQILVSLSGTSNADANSVYAQHVYHMVDVNVGYRFVNALYRHPNDDSLLVDQKLINDVMEQAGGGGEPLQYFDPEMFHEMLVL